MKLLEFLERRSQTDPQEANRAATAALLRNAGLHLWVAIALLAWLQALAATGWILERRRWTDPQEAIRVATAALLQDAGVHLRVAIALLSLQTGPRGLQLECY